MAKTFSGKKVAQVLIREFGFFFVAQKGSHAKLRKEVQGKTITTIVPMHKELAHGTFLGIIGLAQVSEDEFRKAVR